MIRSLFVVIALFVSFPAFAQPNAGPLDSYAWDYTTDNINTYTVTGFEICVDAVCVQRTLAQVNWASPVPTPPAGTNSYIYPLGALTAGQHTVSVAACNSSGCGTTLSTTFNFVITPPPAVNGRFVSGTPGE